MKTNIAIQVEKLSKVYQLRQPRLREDGTKTSEHWALKEVSLEIKKGESVGIIGPNGSGKSTFLKILAGITKPTAGKVSIRGKVASILDIGAGFHPELSGRENVFLNGQIHGFTKKEIESKFDEIVAFSGIERFIDEPIKNYSNGMYLRLAFSITANLNFDVYLFDEVLGVGDAEFREMSLHKIRELITKQDKTVVLISHNLSELSMTCNAVYVARNGLFSGLQSFNEALSTFGLNDSLNKFIPDFVKHVSVEIKNKNGQSQTNFLNDEPIIIELWNTFKTVENVTNIGLVVTDQLGNLVFSTSPMMSPSGIITVDFFKNEYFTFEISPLYFNTGKFFIGLAYFKEEKILAEVDRCSSFTIQMDSRFVNEFKLGGNGPMKPIQDWIIK